ncbi:carbonyl reductase (NADPH-dependent) ari1 [Parahypoxylon ruwenzoriense]
MSPGEIKSLPMTEYPESSMIALCHPRVDEVAKDVENYFLSHWPFPEGKSRKKFLRAGFPRVTCMYFPKAKDDRIHFACRLLTLLFLVDDLIEDMSFEDGAAYNENLMPLSRGDRLPDRTIPVEYITYDLWESMRAHDRELANDVLEPTFVFMRAQTDRCRSQKMSLGQYLEYRERDVGQGLLAALMRFCMKIHLTPTEQSIAQVAEMNCGRHLAVVNDVWSFEKEVLTARYAHEEGGVLCNSVAILSSETTLSVSASKRVLYHMCREWEARHNQLVYELLGDNGSPGLKAYLHGLGYQMSGNEAWSSTTPRYVALGV